MKIQKPRNKYSKRVRIVSECPKNETQQHFREVADINSIMLRVKKTGVFPVQECNPMYGDVSNVEDYQTCLNKINNVMDEFMELPAHIRNRFHHDPAELIGFLENRENMQEAIELGLVEMPEEKTVDKPVEKLAEKQAENTEKANEGEVTT